MGYFSVNQERSQDIIATEEGCVTNELWVTLVISGLVGGLGAVAALSLPAGRDTVGGIASIAGVIVAAWSLGRLIGEYQSSPAPAIATLLAMGAFFGGYSLASAILPQTAHPQEPRPVPKRTGDRTALLLLSDAEPETYSPSATALELVQLQDDDVLRLGIVATPFLFAAQKARYRAVGGISPARRQVREILEAVESSLAGSAFDYFGLAWCSGPETLRDQVEDLVKAGYARVAVLPLGIAESLEMIRAKSLLDRGRPEDAGISVAYGPALGAADAIAALVARRIEVGLDAPDRTGVILVAHGQPDPQAELNPGFDDDEAAFVNRVKMLFTEDTVTPANVRLAWADWREPDITSTVRHLAALGCARILVSPTCYAFDSISTLLDVPIAIRQSRVEPSVPVVTLSTWRDEPEIVDALRAAALDALREFDEVAPEAS